MSLNIDTNSLDRRHLVMIVEDDKCIRAVLADGLSGAFDTVKAADGQAALDLLDQLPQPPDVIMTDVSMPRVDGFELAQRVRNDKRYCEIPIIMVTANADREFKIKALDFGVDDYVTKPFDLAEVRLRVRNLARVRQAKLIISGYAEELESRVSIRTNELQRALRELSSAEHGLREAQAETVIKLAVACEYRDDDTAQHLNRMAGYSRVIAKHIGLSAEHVTTIETAAPMHDIGKIGVPDSILLKPGKLTPDEFKVMQKHPGIGARILAGSTSPLLVAAEQIALTHHEKFDGTGYPRNLKGEQIPIEGRIVALADVFDALTTRRCYKPAFSIERSLEIIREGNGKHFDPAVVDAFNAGFDEVVEICDKHRDPEPIVQASSVERAGTQG
jgi:putative two-component system response regulator